MSMDGAQVLQLLRIFIIVLGGVSALWGIYDMFNDGGGAAAMGWKKIIGGIAFGVIGGIIMTWAINDVKSATAKLPEEPIVSYRTVIAAENESTMFDLA